MAQAHADAPTLTLEMAVTTASPKRIVRGDAVKLEIYPDPDAAG